MRISILLIILMLSLVGCAQSQEVTSFDTVISGYSYNPASITVNYGDKVIISIKNNDAVTHGISLPEFGVREFVKPGETKTIQFVASQRGQPNTFCSTDHGEKLEIKVV